MIAHGETGQEAAVDTVSGEWSSGLGQFYEGIIRGSNLALDVGTIQKRRPEIAGMLRRKAAGNRR